jgi:hypothetical protein
MEIWYIIVAIFLIWVYLNLVNNKSENFVSGTEGLTVTYDRIYPLDNPKYTTPQQKDFQITLSEHSALDPNMQNRRPDIKTQRCTLGTHCFSSAEWHALHHSTTSSPNIINTKIGIDEQIPNTILYTRHNQEKVVPSNSTSKEMRADLFDDIVLPDLFFRKKMVINKGELNPQDRDYATKIY